MQTVQIHVPASRYLKVDNVLQLMPRLNVGIGIGKDGRFDQGQVLVAWLMRALLSNRVIGLVQGFHHAHVKKMSSFVVTMSHETCLKAAGLQIDPLV